jgi:predicted nucleic acid-binding protein
MPGYLLDTQTIFYWSDESLVQFHNVDAAAKARPANSPLYVSAITLGEIEYGHAVYPSGVGVKRNEFIKFMREQLPQSIDVSRHTAEPYGRIRARLVEKFPPAKGWTQNKKRRAEQLTDPLSAKELGIDENDLWLVAQAIERNLVFVTADKMNRIRDTIAEIYPDLRMENWTMLP